MAEIWSWTPEKLDAWKDWLKDRPPIILELAEKFPPNKLFRLGSSGHRVFVYSYEENNTLTVVVSGEYNMVAFERQVFGIHPEDLTECDLPKEGEPLGSFDMDIDEAREAMLKATQHQRN